MSIATRIESIEEHIEDAYNWLEGLGADLTNVNKNIENISMVLDDIYDSMPQVSGEGTSLTLEDTRVGKIKSTLKGNTSQTTYSGKNLLPNNGTTLTRNGMTFTVNDDGSYTLNGTTTSATDYNICQAGELQLEAGTYTLSSTTNIPSGMWLSVYERTSDKWAMTGTNTKTMTVSTATTNAKGHFYINNGVTLNNLRIYPMIVSGTTVGDYEPYTGKTASPNPSYPQPVNVVSGDNKINVVGKNLFDKNNTNIFNGFTNTANNKLEANNNARTICFPCQSSTTYTISKTLSARFIVCETSSATISANIPTTTIEANPQAVSITGTTKSDTKYLLIFYYLSTADTLTENQIRDSIQIERSSSASTYEPYQGNTYNIDLPVENLFDDSTLNNKWVAQNGTITSATGANCIKYNCNANDTYTLSATFGTSSANNIIVMAFYNSSDTLLNRYVTTTNTSLTMTYTAPANTSYMYAGHYGIVPTTIQLEKGSKQNNFTPYGTTPMELCKIGDYQDYIYKENKKWYKYKAIDKVVLDGTQNIPLASGTPRRFNATYTALGIDNVKSGSTTLETQNNYRMCDHFAYTSGVNTWGMYYLHNNWLVMLDGESVIASANDLKNWLASNPTTIYYVLAEPTTEEITDATLISQLEALRNAESYEGQTNISQVNNDLPFIISASALKEWSV